MYKTFKFKFATEIKQCLRKVRINTKIIYLGNINANLYRYAAWTGV